MNKMLLAAAAALAVVAFPTGALAQGKGGGGGHGGGLGGGVGGAMRPATPPGGGAMRPAGPSSHADERAIGRAPGQEPTIHARTDSHASVRAHERTGADVTRTAHMRGHHETHGTDISRLRHERNALRHHRGRMRHKWGGHSCPPGLEKKSTRCVAPGRR